MKEEKLNNKEILLWIYTILSFPLFVYYIMTNKGKDVMFLSCLDGYCSYARLNEVYGKSFFEQLLSFELVSAFCNACMNIFISFCCSVCGAIIPTIIIFVILKIIQLIITFFKEIF